MCDFCQIFLAKRKSICWNSAISYSFSAILHLTLSHSRDQTNRGYKKRNRNRNIYDPYSFSFNRNRIFQNGIRIRFNRIQIFHFSVPFKRKRNQYLNWIIRLNRISNYLTEFGPNNSVQPNIRSFSQFKRNLLLQS